MAAQSDSELVYGVVSSTAEVSAGYVLLAPVVTPTVYLIDNEGRVVHQWAASSPILAAYLLDGGRLLVSVAAEFNAGATERVEMYDWDGHLLWSFARPGMHHDIEPLPNDHVLLAVWETFTAADLVARGLNPALLPYPEAANDPDSGETVWLDTIIEVNPADDRIVWEWKGSDHLIQDSDPALPDYGSLSENPGRINLNYSTPLRVYDRTHINAIDYNPSRDEILLSSHFYNEIWVIDHATTTEEAAGRAGDLLYRWGNPSAYGYGTPLDRQLFLQHGAAWLDNGDILIFNNGAPIFRAYTTVDEITPPNLSDGGYARQPGQPFGPESAVERYNPVGFFYSLGLGSAQALPNGHLLITQGAVGRIFEVDGAGDTVWDYFVPVFVAPTNNSHSPLFHARRYAPDDPALAGRDLTPGDPIPVQTLRGALGD
ncbi:MAG: aryl-sulfate sulfotransferase [Anaerolineaceae bacterium]|nr:aryl-sulfate sulfotransferase [Anaerolineaceae bacterium]